MWQLSEQAHARSEQGSERTVCINAFRGAFYRAVQCCAVRCSEVHWPCLQLLRAGSRNLCCMQAFVARVAVGRAAKAQAEWQRRPLQRGRVHWELTWRAVEADAAPSHGQARIFLIGSSQSESVNRTFRPAEKTLRGPPFFSVTFLHSYSRNRMIDPA
jgi:hypothetical protein